MENLNPGEALDELGITCEQLFNRFRRVGDFRAEQAVWDALSEFTRKNELIESQLPDEFGAES